MHAFHHHLLTPLGVMEATATDEALLSLSFIDTFESVIPSLFSVNPVLRRLSEELGAYFAGELTSFTIPLSAKGTSFQTIVWQELVKTPFGTTRSYGELARAIGCKGARAIARALNANPIAIITPCHRIIASDGLLCGFRAGLNRKRFLIEHERFVKTPPVK